VNKATRKQRTQQEVDQVICWLTATPRPAFDGSSRVKWTSAPSSRGATDAPEQRADYGRGVRRARREHRRPLMRKIRYLDKLIDELAKGKAMEKILRQ